MLNIRAFAAAASLLIVSSHAFDATAQSGDGKVIGTGAVTGFVENMDRSLAFYHDAFGMEVPALPESGARPYNPENVQLYKMFDIMGARERHQSARIPSAKVQFELMEVQDVPHRTIDLRLQDPGALTLVLEVQKLDEVLANAKRANATVVTPGGAPVKLAGGARSVLIKDLDGRHVELREAASSPAAAGASVTGMRISVAVADMEKTLAVYRDLLGFAVEEDKPFAADASLRALTGLAKAEFRRAVLRGPGAAFPFEFVEYRGVDRKPLEMNIQDRGAARVQLRAENLQALVAKMRGAGLKVVSEGGGPVPIPPNFMGALVADPDNFFWTAIAPCDGCAPTLQRAAH